MKRFLIVFGSCLLAMSAVTAASAQDSSSSTYLQRAKHAELVDGDLEAARAMYDRVILSTSSVRPEIAAAIWEKARIAELSGDAEEASELYGQLISEYGDQPAVFVGAVQRLAETARTSASRSRPVATDYRLVMAELPPSSDVNPRQFDFSPDGRRLVYLAPALASRKQAYPGLFSELYVQDQASGIAPRPLVQAPARIEFFGQPRWSPDGEHIFYVALDVDGVWSYWIHNVRSGTSERMAIDPPLKSERGVSWFPDSRRLILARHQHIGIYDLSGSNQKTIFVENLDWQSQLGDISADGRRVLVSLSRGEGSQDHDVWALDIETEDVTRLTDRTGFDGWPIWGPDGGSVFFTSDRSGPPNVFRRSPTGEISEITSYKNATVLHPTLVNGRSLAFALIRQDHSVMLAEGGDFANARMLARGKLPTTTSGGEAVYYLSEDDGLDALRVLELNTGESRVLLTGEIASAYGPMTWVSPDGSEIACFVREGTESVLYVIAGDGQSRRRLYTMQYPGTSVPAWSPDGREIVFTEGGQMKVIAAGGGRPEVIAEGVTEWEGWIVRWAPDGNRIAAFAYLEGESENTLMVVDRSTRQVTRVTPPEEDAYKEYLDWHPSGDAISYMTYHGRYQDGSRMVNLATGEARTIAQMPDPMWDYFGTWAPDGNYYFTSGVRGSWIEDGLYSYAEDGSIKPVRVQERRQISVPSWSEDGSVATWFETEHRRQLWMISDF